MAPNGRWIRHIHSAQGIRAISGIVDAECLLGLNWGMIQRMHCITRTLESYTGNTRSHTNCPTHGYNCFQRRRRLVWVRK
jgi:hypothetical protein